MSKLTGLFPMSVKPVRDGVYQVERANGRTSYSHFRGGAWRSCCAAPDVAAYQSMRSDWCYTKTVVGWRGLAKAPK